MDIRQWKSTPHGTTFDFAVPPTIRFGVRLQILVVVVVVVVKKKNNKKSEQQEVGTTRSTTTSEKSEQVKSDQVKNKSSHNVFVFHTISFTSTMDPALKLMLRPFEFDPSKSYMATAWHTTSAFLSASSATACLI